MINKMVLVAKYSQSMLMIPVTPESGRPGEGGSGQTFKHYQEQLNLPGDQMYWDGDADKVKNVRYVIFVRAVFDKQIKKLDSEQKKIWGPFNKTPKMFVHRVLNTMPTHRDEWIKKYKTSSGAIVDHSSRVTLVLDKNFTVFDLIKWRNNHGYAPYDPTNGRTFGIRGTVRLSEHRKRPGKDGKDRFITLYDK